MSNYLKDNFWNEDTKCIDGAKLWSALQSHIEKEELIVSLGKGDREGLVLVTYSKIYQYDHYAVPWDPLVLNCRGIIFDATENYKIVALPFAKFFNYGEGNQHYPAEGATLEAVYEKVDGSLGICFYWHSKWHITTRGSLNSDIGNEAQKMLDELISSIGHPPSTQEHAYTYLFEIVYPGNRVCVDYKGARKLVYLGARKTANGQCLYGCEWLLVSTCLFFIPRNAEPAAYYTLYTLEAVQEFLVDKRGQDFEGFVLQYSDGLMFKTKGADYNCLHRIISKISFKKVFEALQEGTPEAIRQLISDDLIDPEELIQVVESYKVRIQDHINKIINRVELVVRQAPMDSRKEFALWLKMYHKGSDVIKYAFRFVDLNYNKEELYTSILRSLDHSDFAIVEKAKDLDG